MASKIQFQRDKIVGGYFFFDEGDDVGLSISHRDRNGDVSDKWYIRAWVVVDGKWDRVLVGNTDGYDKLYQVKQHIADVETDRANGHEVHWYIQSERQTPQEIREEIRNAIHARILDFREAGADVQADQIMRYVAELQIHQHQLHAAWMTANALDAVKN
jgi:hypothetical protein